MEQLFAEKLRLSPNSLSVMTAKYLRKNEKGEIAETPEEAFRRVAFALAKIEETAKLRQIWEEKFFQIMSNLEFFPGGRTLANAGTPYPQLANCFVLPFEDNIEEIFEIVKESSILKKFGGGVGFSFSKIRPKNDVLVGTSGYACGPVALMKILDSASEIFMQQGTRRSGNMVVLNVTHPDILSFILAKKERGLEQINYSLGVTDKFMKAVISNKNWNLINPRTGKVIKTLKARSIFNLACEMAHRNGDPGMIFLDEINRKNPTNHLGPIEAVNLCGEQPLHAYEACNLGSINLTKFLLRKVSKGEKKKQTPFDTFDTFPAFDTFTIDWSRLAEVIETSVRLLDNVIDAGRYPLPKVDRVVKANRRIGLGVMGWADLLIKLGLPYNSQKARDLGEKMMKFITEKAWKASMKIGREKGSFPNFVGSAWQKKKKFRWMRNATVTTIAPTGSISMLAGVSSGIEPLFSLSYYKEVLGGQRFSYQLDQSDKFDQSVLVTAHEISASDHIKMQAAFQKYTDNAVSKTINLPEKATVKDVSDAFLLAWKLGCKGITVYRDKSRSKQVLNIGSGAIGKREVRREKRDIEVRNLEFKKSKNQSLASHFPSLASVSNDQCPTCGKPLVREEGCLHCPACGFSACEL